MMEPILRRIALLSLAPLAALLIASCSGSASTGPALASSTGAPDACSAREKDARASARAAVEAHRACNADADCETVEIGNGCFDACTDSVNHEGKAAVESALAASNASGCSKFEADGCKRIVPPCMPPQAPKCGDGLCQ